MNLTIKIAAEVGQELNEMRIFTQKKKAFNIQKQH